MELERTIELCMMDLGKNVYGIWYTVSLYIVVNVGACEFAKMSNIAIRPTDRCENSTGP